MAFRISYSKFSLQRKVFIEHIVERLNKKQEIRASKLLVKLVKNIKNTPKPLTNPQKNAILSSYHRINRSFEKNERTKKWIPIYFL